MSITPSGPQISIKYTLTGPSGAVATFNEPLDANFVGYLTEVTGLDGAEVRENAENLAGIDGGVHGDFLFGRRPVTLSGQIVNVVSNTDRNQKLDKLLQASNAMRGDATLEWTPSGGELSYISVRRAAPPRVTGGWVKDFQLSLVAADPRIYARASSAVTISATEPTNLATGSGPASIVASEDGKNVYVAAKTGNKVYVYTRSLETGELTELETKALAGAPAAVAVSKDDKNVYVTQSSEAKLAVYTRNTTTGALTVGTAVATGTEPVGVTVAETWVATSNKGSNNISTFARNTSTGALTVKSTLALTGGEQPVGLAWVVYTKMLYVICSKSSTIHVLTVTTAGAPTEKSKVVSIYSGTISAFATWTSGTFQEVVIAGGAPGFYQLSGYTNSNTFPTLSMNWNREIPQKPTGMAHISAAKNTIFVSLETGSVEEFLNVKEGPSSGVTTGTKPSAICLASGETGIISAYVTNSEANTISEYKYGTVSGLLTHNLQGVTCTNTGSERTFPFVTITINSTGEIIEPIIVNSTTGEAISFGATFPAGSVIVLDMQNRTATMNGTSIYGSINFSTSQWWAIEPGANKILISSNGAAAKVDLKVDFQSAWA